jgi:hypothetical protein
MNLRPGFVGFLILDDPFTRPRILLKDGKQLAIYICDRRRPILSNAQPVAAITHRVHPPLRSMLVRRMRKRMYEVGNNLLVLTMIVPWHSFDFLRVERKILTKSSTDNKIAVQGRTADDINATIQDGAHASLYMIRCGLMKKDVDIRLSRMGRRSDAGGKESQEGQNRRSLHDEVLMKKCECKLIVLVKLQGSLL